MNPDEARQLLQQDLDHPGTVDITDLRQAQQLGIETLKWRALMEHDYGSWCGPLLPGETEPQDDPLHSRYYKRPIKNKEVSK